MNLLDFCGSSVEEGGSSDANLGLSHCGTIPEDEGVLLVHSHACVPLWTSGFGRRLFIRIGLEIFYVLFCFVCVWPLTSSRKVWMLLIQVLVQSSLGDLTNQLL